MKVELTDQADAEVEDENIWWRENRPSAPALFDQELMDALELLEELPKIGVIYRPRPRYRRLLLRRTGYHLYYRVDERAEVLYVVTIWHARRGRRPRL